MLWKGGHAVDAAVSTALCLGVVNPMSSGLGGGAFMRQDMYENHPEDKSKGPLSMAVPGELAGLYEAWRKYGRLPWKTLFQPSIEFAKKGFEVLPYLAKEIVTYDTKILGDPGLKQVFAPKGRQLQTGDKCYNVKLAESLEAVVEEGPRAFYNGTVVGKGCANAGGILTMEDLRNYKAKVTDALAVEVMGYKLLGMPPPSSGTLGISLILNVLSNYGSASALQGSLGLHRLSEGMKHMFAIRMNLGDPDFVDIAQYMSNMTSPSFAKKIWQRIYDNTTFPPGYYVDRWSQLQDHGTSHFCIVDADRNAVSMTTTVNAVFGAGVLSSSTGIVLNNEMDDFSTPTEVSPDQLPPAPANFTAGEAAPDNKLAVVIGGSGGMDITLAVTEVFINHFVLGMEALAAVQSPRVYPKVVSLEGRHHQLKAAGIKAICQLIMQTFESSVDLGRKHGRDSLGSVNFGTLTAVRDPRKDGKPAAEVNDTKLWLKEGSI
ncbi:LOW QUALITY PROTEIN: hypothetical protein Cgig2_004227 [Carnegiea gigantea]|uniref:Uncharacterized protein n=1 Tax=Carnegiea gigantea TaxID=171969 RepID=A0A9Q1K3W8_9CARY|nr:LOW QUALITY PROTEIN: hypothetical protein Cgig2_004227 [Carnegiea gigantea]